MDIEQLTKSQIVLLVLFVSFVTSMATGIVTVTLMDQAPTDMTYTINRFIEQTAQAVGNAVPGSLDTKTTPTVVVQEDNSVATATATVSPSLVRVYAAPDNDKTQTGDYIGVGILFSDAHRVATDALGITRKGSYRVKMNNGTVLSAEVSVLDDGHNLAILNVSASEGTVFPKGLPVTPVSSLRLGQSVIVLGGKDSNEIAKGMITLISEKNTSVETDITHGGRFSGGAVFSTAGTIIGMALTRDGAITIIPASVIQDIATPATPAGAGN